MIRVSKTVGDSLQQSAKSVSYAQGLNTSTKSYSETREDVFFRENFAAEPNA